MGGVWHRGCQRHSNIPTESDPAEVQVGGDALPPDRRSSEPVHPWVGQPRPAGITVVRSHARRRSRCPGGRTSRPQAGLGPVTVADYSTWEPKAQTVSVDAEL